VLYGNHRKLFSLVATLELKMHKNVLATGAPPWRLFPAWRVSHTSEFWGKVQKRGGKTKESAKNRKKAKVRKRG